MALGGTIRGKKTTLRLPAEAGLTGLTVGRDAYDAIQADPSAWTGLRTELQQSLFVDMRRLFLA